MSFITDIETRERKQRLIDFAKARKLIIKILKRRKRNKKGKISAIALLRMVEKEGMGGPAKRSAFLHLASNREILCSHGSKELFVSLPDPQKSTRG